MPKFASSRRSLLLAAALATAAPLAALAQEAKPVRVLSNWFAQPDQGGY